ncbi:HD domain-containing protein [candidate division WOR-3 bacterium]|nr:HD domain-containing protein [candidate division WOR-3 bacterium]
MDNNLEYFTEETMKPIFELLYACGGVEQQIEYHPEGDVLRHTFQVFKWAIRESMDLDLILAALLHDVGKATYSNNHERDSVKMIEGFSSCKTVWLVKNHMRIWTYLKGEMQGLKKCLELANHCWLPELIQLARWDAKGRNPNSQCYFPREEIMRILNGKAKAHFDKGGGMDGLYRKAHIGD